MTGLGYTVPAVVSAVLVCVLELAVLRTGLFRRAAYWISMVIVIGFQILVDGWLTKLSAPIVLYNEQHSSGIRFPWDIPVEDFLFGFALVTGVMLLWDRQRPSATTSSSRKRLIGTFGSSPKRLIGDSGSSRKRLIGDSGSSPKRLIGDSGSSPKRLITKPQEPSP